MTSTCPEGVEDAVGRGVLGYNMYQGIETHPASASETPLDVLVPLAEGLCVIGYEGQGGGSNTYHGTVFFLPAERLPELVSALADIGYNNHQMEYLYTLGGELVSGTANVTASPADYWDDYQADFTSFFPEPILVVSTEIRG